MIPSVKRQRTEEKKGKTAIIYPYPKTECIARVSVHEFFYGQEKKKERDLFLQAMNEFMSNTNTDDPWSYYAISGIHGLPELPYDSAVPPDRGRGYCEHGTVLFPTWHRAYMLLFEQGVIRAAKSFANKLDNQAQKDDCLNLANLLRIPYLDWESSFTAYQGLPDIFIQTTVSVTYPNATTIPNPLRSYVLPVALGQPISASDVFNPTAKPYYQPPDVATPFTPPFYPTVRHPDATYQSPADTLNLTVQRNCNLVLRPQLYAAMLQTDWLQFSNHYSNDTSNYGHFASLEVVHDAFHDTIGGQGGHMSYPDTAAFDPIFWFHHSNVDRLLAIWQYANPTSYVPDPSIEKPQNKNKTTPLTPFWSYKATETESNQYLTSIDVKSISEWNYTYPAIRDATALEWTPEEMKHYIMRKFQPDHHYGIRWYLDISNLPKHLDVGPYEVRVFIDLPDANMNTPLYNPHYAGNVFVFARSNLSNCTTCEQVPYIRGSVELTSTMKQLGISVDTEIGSNGIPNNPFREDFGNFTLVYVTAAGKEIKLDESGPRDSTGKRRTKPSLALGWFMVYDDQTMNQGDMKPEQLDQVFKLVSSAPTGTARRIKAPLYKGGIIHPQS